MKHVEFSVAAICGVGVLTAAASAGVVVNFGLTAQAQTMIPSGADDYDYHDGAVGPISASATSLYVEVGQHSSASAVADFGSLHAYAFSDGGNSGILQNALAVASWTDTLTPSGSAPAMVSFTFALDGTLSQFLDSPFFPSSNAGLGAYVDGILSYQQFSQVGSGSQTISTTVTLGPYMVNGGVPSFVQYFLQAYINGRGEADFLSTATYTGYSATDLNGAPVSLTFQSASGFDYSVPAPGAGAVLVLGGLCAARRRR